MFTTMHIITKGATDNQITIILQKSIFIFFEKFSGQNDFTLDLCAGLVISYTISEPAMHAAIKTNGPFLKAF